MYCSFYCHKIVVYYLYPPLLDVHLSVVIKLLLISLNCSHLASFRFKIGGICLVIGGDGHYNGYMVCLG